MHIKINIADQTLILFAQNNDLLKNYLVSTAKNGPGEQMNSEKTPTGSHKIRAKIGAGEPANTVFVGRRPTGEIYSEEFAKQFKNRDWILTRILWLSGSDPGHNRFGNVDTMRRYVYIHGTPDKTPMGRPGSRGCVRMRNQDMIELFDMVDVDTSVLILI